MERKDFYEITPAHIEICEIIIDKKGECSNIKCFSCPFSRWNNTKDKTCYEQYSNELSSKNSKDQKLVESAKEFIRLFEKDFQPKVTERIEDTQEFKDKHKHNATVEESNIKPNHYKLNIKGQDIEVMDIIDAVVKDMDGRKGYIVGNILKYVCRAEKKNGLEDYKKARTYLDMLISNSNTTNEIPQELENERFFNSGAFRESNIIRAEKVIKEKLKKNIDDLKPLTRVR